MCDSNDHLLSVTKTMPLLQGSSNNSFSEPGFPFKRSRCSLPILKAKKSKQNHFSCPQYSHTNKRTLKEFLSCEGGKNLNYEIGIYKVLIVDDIEENRKIIKELLRRVIPEANFEFAKDGIEAIEMYDNYSSQGYMYKIIFMDLIMPRLYGDQACLRIRQKEKERLYPRTFICAVSGNKDCSAKCSESDMDDLGNYYTALKPITVSMLESIIRNQNELV